MTDVIQTVNRKLNVKRKKTTKCEAIRTLLSSGASSSPNQRRSQHRDRDRSTMELSGARRRWSWRWRWSWGTAGGYGGTSSLLVVLRKEMEEVATEGRGESSTLGELEDRWSVLGSDNSSRRQWCIMFVPERGTIRSRGLSE